MLLDAASMYFRAYYGVPESMTAPDGSPVNAIRGFLDMTARLVTSRRPTSLVACLDYDWRPAFRVEAIPTYKTHRVATGSVLTEDTPETLGPQVPVLLEVLAAMGLATVGAAGFEADDVIGTLADRADGPVEVVTGDRDLFQLVRDEPPIRILYIARSVAKLEVLGPAEVGTKYDIPGTAYADFAALRGDPSDGLPGVPGVGDKTAAALINAYGSLSNLLDALDDAGDGLPPKHISGGVRAKLQAARDYLTVAPRVVDVRRDVPVPAGLHPQLPTTPADPAALVALCDRWGLDTSVGRLLKALDTARG
ncbi:MAG: 5'-3' exonuclease [Geodermatophilaceae bacterium]|nr:5'-3' exonuclease [Geodermatophilaceae bacterium]